MPKPHSKRERSQTLSEALDVMRRIEQLGFRYFTLYAMEPVQQQRIGDLPFFTVEQIRESGLEEEPMIYYVDPPGGLIEPSHSVSMIKDLLDQGTIASYRLLWAGFNPSNNPWGALPSLFDLMNKKGEPTIFRAAEAEYRKLSA